jgi:CHRD domain
VSSIPTRWTAAATAALALAATAGVAAGATSTTSQTFNARLVASGAQKGTKAPSGRFVGHLEKNGMLKYTVTFAGITGKLSSATIQTAKSGATGSSSIPLTAKLGSSPISGTLKPTKSLLAALRSGKASVWVKATKPTAAISGSVRATKA